MGQSVWTMLIKTDLARLLPFRRIRFDLTLTAKTVF
jgi:hypothetical protein